MRSVLVTLLVVAASASAFAAESVTVPETALAKRGFVTEYTTAIKAIAFRPFVPRAPIQETALLPAFHGEQISKNEGLGLAYARNGRSWILQQWPRNGGSLAAFAPLPTEAGCGDVHAVGGRAKPHGVAWTTPHGMVFSLTPDGNAEERTILAEFRRLVRFGACR